MRTALLILGLSVSFKLFAQDPTLAEVPTPNAMEIARFGNVPVSYYTGKPNITVPICDWDIKGVNMRIELAYDASGVALNNLPGWLGHNWSLQAGGIITRTTCGTPDEYVPPFADYTKYYFCNYFHAFGILKNIMSSNNYMSVLEDSIYDEHVLTDYSPDIFSFSFMGKSGRFFLGNDGYWKVQSQENIEVVFDIADESNYIRPFIDHFPYSTSEYQPKTIKGFMLRDEKGTRYYFGGSTDAIEYNLRLAGMGDTERCIPWLANSWYLTKVEDRHGNKLFELTYTRGKFMVQMHHSYYYRIIENCHKEGSFFTGLSVGDQSTLSNQSFPYSVHFNAPVFLSGIYGSDGKDVLFLSSDLKIPLSTLYPEISNRYDMFDQMVQNWEYHKYYYLQTEDPNIRRFLYKPDSCDLYHNPFEATCLRKLNGISLGGFPGIREVDFEYSFDSRMHLTGLEIHGYEDPDRGEEDDRIGRYALDYYSFGWLPSSYLTKETDSWGFYSRIANQNSQGMSGHLPRSVDPQSSNIGVLKEIVYPTGGCSRFVYEQNAYGKLMSTNRQTAEIESGEAGGLRIKSITDYEDDSHSTILSMRTFEYLVPGTETSSGQLFALPMHYLGNWRINYDEPNTYSEVTFIQSASIVPLSNSFGPHIGYSYVKEIFADSTYIIRHYTNIADFPDQKPLLRYNLCSPDDVTPYDKYSESGYKRGRLLSQAVYDSNNNIKQKTEYTYGGDDQEHQYVLSSNLAPENLSITSATFAHITGGVYKLYYSKYDITSSKTTTYGTDGSFVVDSTYYAKTNKLIPVSFGDYHNLADVRLLGSQTHFRAGDSHSTVYEYPDLAGDSTEQKLMNEQFCLVPLTKTEYHNGNEIHKQKTGYSLMNGMILPQYVLEWKNASIIPDTLITYYSYDQYGSPTHFREWGMPHTWLTWTSQGNYITHKIVGNNHITQYEYDDDHNIVSITQPNGNITYYQYDTSARLRETLNRNRKIVKKYEYNYRNK